MAVLRFLLGDQLTPALSALDGIDRGRDVVLMAEVAEEASYVGHHKQKIALVLAAMRHFAEALRAEGVTVDYVRLDDAGNTGSLGGELKRAVARHRPEAVVMTEPGEWRVEEAMRDWREELDVPLTIRSDRRFLCSREEFRGWAAGRTTYRMEDFYREMRRRTGLLMTPDGEPEGGRWNFDQENRKRLPRRIEAPPRRERQPDAATREVLDLVAARFAENFGDLEPFGWAVTRAEALAELEGFVETALPAFGDYQDAMRTGDAFLFHAVLSPYLNLGLLDPLEVCRAAEEAWRAGRVPLNAAEGFVRQIIGWREYVRGIYWTEMPDYAASNALGAGRPLPWFYWSGETPMNCLAQCIGDTRRHAYAHHIQRLMVTGNFALLAGIAPAEVEEWYLAVYADAYEWVELPNTHGMILFADGGLLGSKPYAASGAYIDRMSDYCGACAFDVREKLGPRACPFNYLYWNFLLENEAILARNRRLAMPYRTLAGMDAERIRAIRADARRFLEALDPAPPSS